MELRGSRNAQNTRGPRESGGLVPGFRRFLQPLYGLPGTTTSPTQLQTWHSAARTAPLLAALTGKQPAQVECTCELTWCRQKLPSQVACPISNRPHEVVARQERNGSVGKDPYDVGRALGVPRWLMGPSGWFVRGLHVELLYSNRTLAKQVCVTRKVTRIGAGKRQNGKIGIIATRRVRLCARTKGVKGRTMREIATDPRFRRWLAGQWWIPGSTQR
ncbi:hypothetical protein B0T26DRAFT_358166 [Lasiosphaeria miniovina]|uniref:Uncharacterized protein n=1 Tax=Lasiosphaeria miniovina TaxID=1954250 RepID=A0AA40DR70_9PEZI|nr:uncharacterized protein B0T26DRAFT_358166 [Lasiosphaeria miniovina]KAK0713149.1 hypothetical protein B0T26DRAFT_358166 [Lasiosphaeria miniovina]